MDNKKHDCYKCKFVGTVPGDVHRCCNALVHDPTAAFAAGFQLLMAGYKVEEQSRPVLGIDFPTGDKIVVATRGVQRGWASWPGNFDPVGIESCSFYAPKKNQPKTVRFDPVKTP